MKSSEQKQLMIEAGYDLAKELGHPNVVTFDMVASKAGCSEALVKTYLINKGNLRAEILKSARKKGDENMLARVRLLKRLSKKTTSSKKVNFKG